MRGVPVVKDPDNQQPVPTSWRPVLTEVVRSLVRGVAIEVDSVEPVTPEQAEAITENVAAYGDVTLIELPDAAWDTSTTMWMGSHWEVLIDLWTAEEGRSDLVLHLMAFEDGARYRFTFHLLYVP